MTLQSAKELYATGTDLTQFNQYLRSAAQWLNTPLKYTEFQPEEYISSKVLDVLDFKRCIIPENTPNFVHNKDIPQAWPVVYFIALDRKAVPKILWCNVLILLYYPCKQVLPLVNG